MDIDQILHPEVQAFISSNENADVQKLLLSRDSIHNIPTKEIVQQIAGRRKIREKLPTWFSTNGILYPPFINLEQSSSESTARFKASLLKDIFKNDHNVADLTGGYGVDAFYFSQYAKHVHYVEPDKTLLEIVSRNFSSLNKTNITIHHQSAESFLNASSDYFDFIFVDPSRRKDAKKVFMFGDCLPDVISLQRQLFEKSNFILVKASPMLDLQQGIKELNYVSRVYVVSVGNECKELLFLQEKNFNDPTSIFAVDLDDGGTQISSFSFKPKEEAAAVVSFSDPSFYLYEPNPSILKAGAFRLMSQTHQLDKLAPNTHFYTSSEIRQDFQGKIFKIINHVKLDGDLKKSFSDGYANIISRNHPLSVEAIKKKTGLKEGGELFLICTQGQRKKFSLMAERIK